jgi:predicted CoA-binding protein
MDLKDIMQFNSFVVVGNTLDEDKYAYKIKNELIKNGYKAFGVYKEYKSIDEINEDIDVIDLCINPIKGLFYLENTKKKYKAILAQPGAESSDIKNFAKKHNIEYLEACALVGLKLYKKKEK